MSDMIPGEYVPATLETYWTVPQIAKAFQVTNDTVRNWITDGLLRAIKIGQMWRVANADLIVFTEKRYADG